MLDIIILGGLTIAAWKRGWGKWALIPSVSYLPLAFFIGMVLGAVAGSTTSLRSLEGMSQGIAFMLFIVVCIALIGMIIKGRKTVRWAGNQAMVNRQAATDSQTVTNTWTGHTLSGR